MPKTAERESLLPAILAKSGLKYADSDLAAEQIALRVMNEDDIDKLLDIQGTLSSEAIIGVPFKLRDAQLMQSEIEDSAGVYMLLDAVMLDTGEPTIISTGAAEVMLKAAKLVQLGALPQNVKIIEKRAGQNGRSAPLSLVRATWQPGEKGAAR